MTPDEQERFICRQLDDLRDQYHKACKLWFKRLSYIRSLRPTHQNIIQESEYKKYLEQP